MPEEMGSRAEELAAELRASYEEYTKRLQAYKEAKSSAADRMNAWFMGNREFAGLAAHREFFEKAESLAGELAGALDSQPSPALAAETVRWMLAGGLAENDPAYWMFIAAESLCIPLLPFVPTEDLRDIQCDYRRRLKKKRGLPNQKKTAKAMEAELRAREKRQ